MRRRYKFPNHVTISRPGRCLVRPPHRAIHRADRGQSLPIQPPPHVPLRKISRSLGLYTQSRSCRTAFGWSSALAMHSTRIIKVVSGHGFSRADSCTCIVRRKSLAFANDLRPVINSGRAALQGRVNASPQNLSSRAKQSRDLQFQNRV